MSAINVANSFVWRIPLIQPAQANIVCLGYIRQATTSDDIYKTISANNNIMDLCIDYLGNEFYDMKHAKAGQGYISNIFILSGLKWIIELLPSGINIKHNTLSCSIYTLSLLPHNQHSITIKYNITFKYKHACLDKEISVQGAQYTLDIANPIRWISSFNINEIHSSFTLVFKIISSDQNIPVTIITNNPSITCTNSYEWEIPSSNRLIAKKSKTSVRYHTSLICMHSLKWYLTYDDVGSVALVLLSSLLDINAILIHYTLTVNDIYIASKCFYIAKHCRTDAHNNEEWKQLQDIEGLKFKLSITMLNIYPVHGCTVAYNYYENALPNECKTGSYIWRTPYLNDIETECLCYGYIKTIAFPYYIPDSLMHLCRLFMDNKPVLNKIKNAKKYEKFDSDIFCINGLKYKMRIYPNTTGRFDWYFTLISMSSEISGIGVFFRVILEEKHIVSTGTVHFDGVTSLKRWKDVFVLNKDIECVSSLTFRLEVVILDVFDCDRNMITDYRRYLSETDKIYDVTDGYRWNITDIETVENIKNASNSIGFFADCFIINGIKWILELYPNGESLEDEDNATLYLTMASLPPNICCVFIKYDLLCIEKDIRFSRIAKFDGKHTSKGWINGTLKNKDIQDLKTLTFECFISLIDIYNIYGSPITTHWIHTKHKALQSTQYYEYKWKISPCMITQMKSAANCDGFQSKIFVLNGFQWMLELFPNGNCIDCAGNVNMFLHLVSIPMELNNIYFQSSIFVAETNTQYQLMDTFNHKDTSTGWPDGRLMTYKIKDCCEMTLRLRIVVVDVYDRNGKQLDINRCCDNVRKYKSLYDIYNINWNKYVWRIEDMDTMKCAKNGDMFESDIFEIDKLQWFLTVYPNGESQTDIGNLRLCINLKQLPMGIKCVTFHFELYIVETNTRYSNFSHFIDDYLSKGWRGCYLRFHQIQELKAITVQITLGIMDIYDDCGKSVLYEFIS